MQPRLLSLFVAALLAVPSAVRAQFLFQETLEPRVDAAQEQWQIAGEPLLLDGLIYDPSGPARFFDPNVMVRTGVYRGIPVYQDRTLEPYSIVYVPIGSRLMRPYERRRTGDLASTQGSRTSNYPASTSRDADVESDLALATPVGTGGVQTPAPASGQAGNTYVKTAGVVITNATPASLAAGGGVAASTVAPARIESIPAPSGRQGIYVEYDGARWYNSGAPMPYAADRFTPIGDYAGFVVYRLRGDSADRIWVPVVEGGLLAQYSRR